MSAVKSEESPPSWMAPLLKSLLAPLEEKLDSLEQNMVTKKELNDFKADILDTIVKVSDDETRTFKGVLTSS